MGTQPMLTGSARHLKAISEHAILLPAKSTLRHSCLIHRWLVCPTHRRSPPLCQQSLTFSLCAHRASGLRASCKWPCSPHPTC
eukprot:3308228-Pleurochrysis_carterae.AAC.1